MSRQLLIALIVASGCSRSLPPVDTQASALQQAGCPNGVESTGPNQCMTVPPVNKPPASPDAVWDPFIVDGTRTKTEYFGAIDFPYAHPGLQLSGGHVLVNIDQDLKTLHVFLQNLPALPKGEIRIYLDHQRFKSSPDGDTTFNDPTTEDRAYSIDLTTGVRRILHPVKTFGVISWQPIPLVICLPNNPCPPQETFEGVLGNMTAPNADGVVRFNAEYSIPLPALGSVPNGGPPGVGFAAAQWSPPPSTGTTLPPVTGVGAFPEEMAIAGTHLVQHGNTQVVEEIPSANVIDDKRLRFQTLVFGPPAGTPLKFMTWNIKRFTSFMHFVEGIAGGSPFDDSQVPPQLIGQFLAPFDVVALQEAWSDDDLQQILAAANAARAGMGLTPFFQIGPIDFPKGQGISFDSTTGGVYILSKFPPTQIDYHVYDNCRGEDCLKAKGVLHARLNFSTTTVGGGAPTSAGAPPPPMKPDNFVDVYATHMQADEQVCSNASLQDQVKSKVLEGIVCGALPEMWAACFIKEIVEATLFHCHDFPDDQTVRELQVAELDTFVRATADRTRPSIMLGDFNQDSAFLNNDTDGAVTGRYGKLLSQLQLGNVGADSSLPAPDDRLDPWPVGFGFPWQLDHSDVMRETFSDAFLTKFGRGTDIGATSADDPPPGMVKTQLARIDYAFIRPGAQPGSTAFGDVAWMAGKPSVGTPVWSSPWPLAASPINTVGNRMSDHKPVIFSFQMVPFKPAPKFHPGWTHDLGFRVTTANDTGDDDCFGCGELDLYTKVHKRAVSVNAAVSSATFIGTECSEGGAIVSAGVNPGCVGTWAFHIKHDPAISAVTGGGVELWEDDSDPNQDDFLDTIWGGSLGGLYSVNWPMSRIEMRDLATATAKPCIDNLCVTHWNDLTLADNGAYGFCTRTVAPFVCVELKITEIPPTP